MIFCTTSKSGALLLGVLALIGIAGCVLYTFHVRFQAESCLNSVRQIHVGSSTQDEVRKTLDAYRCFETDGTAMISGKDYHTYSYLIKNSGFHLLKVFHPTQFGVSLTFLDGVVVEKYVILIREPFHLVVDTRETITGLMQDYLLSENPSGMLVGEWDPPSRMDVHLDARASEADRKAAFDYNLGCFTSVFGCRSVYKILPGVEHHGMK
jgi:hypothetical protein